MPLGAKWELAVRRGIVCWGNSTFSGDNTLGDVGWCSGGGTRDVGTRRPNALGIYDMSGNVSEWVYDRFGTYPNTAQTNPTGPAAGGLRVERGGCWSSTPADVRSAHRLSTYPDNRLSYLGFRLVRL